MGRIKPYNQNLRVKSIMVLVVGVLAVCGLSGCGKTQVDETAAAEKVLKPFMEQVEQRYNTQYKDLKDSCDKLDAENKSLMAQNAELQKQVQAAQQGAQAAKAELDNYKTQYKTLAGQAAAAQTALANITDERALFEQRFLQSQVEVALLQSQLKTSQQEYDEIYTNLVKVDKRTDPTINDYTAAQRTAFYLIWDKWWDVVIAND